jgi:hypothetical protein
LFAAQREEIRGDYREVPLKTPIVSPSLTVPVSFLAFGMVCAAWSGVARAGVADPAPPGACGAAIARLETEFNQARAKGQALASAPESIGAMLHHQPTQESVARAQSESEKRVEASLALARTLRAEGRRSKCIATVEQFPTLR